MYSVKNISIKRFVILLFQWLIERVNFLVDVMVTNIRETSRSFNTGICEQYNVILTNVSVHPENTEELVKLKNYVENLKCGELLQLKVFYK